MDSKQSGKNASKIRISSSQNKVQEMEFRQKQSTPSSTSIHSSMSHRHATPQHSTLGKRILDNSRETSRERSNPATKRARQKSFSPANQLCDNCSSIRWDLIDQWMNYDGRIDLHGRPIDVVGTNYRNVSPSTTCSLCHQLHASWIEPFLAKRIPSRRNANYGGDQIRIFRHLRHLPHVNDKFQTGRNVLREHNTPYHIAVVPDGQGWLNDLVKHIEVNGMVVVLPEGHPESEIFVPQQVSPKFDPNVVLPWLGVCKGHKNRCRPKAPVVTGMRLIDCTSKDLIIREYRPDDKYVALSYVWGDQTPGGTSTMASIDKATLQTEDTTKASARRIQPVVHPAQYLHKPGQTLSMASKRTQPASAAPQEKLLLRLPKDIPQTVKDAIHVTRRLGYHSLWVDKYCIDQSNEAEKKHQFSRMGDIYSGSQITLFALGPNSNYGLPGVSFRPRSMQRECTRIRKYQFISTMPDPHFSIRQSKWATRGWTYQEGLFSTRRLFFTNFQIYFECNAMNCAESFKSNLKILHIQNGQRLRAYHRAGRFVCGNSNQYSHVEVKQSKANHRKIDTIRRCQYQIRQYTKTELTNKDDILNAFSSIARFYAKSTSKIASLAGIPIPSPIANLQNSKLEALNHLSYALAWTHCTAFNPNPQRRKGFPSWSWAGWIGTTGKRHDFPFCWTSHLSSVRIGYQGDDIEDYASLQKLGKYKHYMIQKLLTANALHFDAYVLNPQKLKFWRRDPNIPSKQILTRTIYAYMSTGSSSLEELYRRLMDGYFQCLVLGTHGEPDKDIFKAIVNADKKSPKYKKRRMELFERQEPDAIICLIVHTVQGTSYREGLLKVGFNDLVGGPAILASDLINKKEHKREQTQEKVWKWVHVLLQAKEDEAEAQNALTKAKQHCQKSRKRFNAAFDTVGVSPQLIDEYHTFCKSLQPKIGKSGLKISYDESHDGDYKTIRKRKKGVKVTEYIVEFFPPLDIEPMNGPERTSGEQYPKLCKLDIKVAKRGSSITLEILVKLPEQDGRFKGGWLFDYEFDELVKNDPVLANRWKFRSAHRIDKTVSAKEKRRLLKRANGIN